MNEYLKKLLKAKAEKNLAIQKALEKSAESGETPDEETEKEIEQHEADIAAIEKNIARTEKQIAQIEQAAKSAKPVEGDTPENAAKSADPNNTPVVVKSNLPKGLGFALAVKATVAAHKSNQKNGGGGTNAIEVLKSWNAPESVQNLIRAKANIGTTTGADFAAALVDQQNLTNEFIELLRPATILGRMTGFRNVPFNVKIPTQTGSTSVNWVGEGQQKPTTDMKFGNITLTKSKLAGIVLLSDELIRFSSPSADALVRDDLVKTISQFIDGQFLDPSKVESEDSPASILNGIAGIKSTGTTAEAYQTDLLTCINGFIDGNQSLDGSYWVMSETRAAQMSLLRDALGNTYFPGMSFGSGSKTLLGLPVVTSQTAGEKIVLIKPTEILLADDGGVDFAISNEATITNGTEAINLFQNNLSAIRAERYIRWKPVRKAAGWIDYSA
ncbi:phage major capsid protein [Acinetobacter sp. HY1485]|uniref:phage major capsid protein n=1 Tax=Acinetobacter sp. HY1485 TaxID=2970918 RepID=UPI0022B98B32|nr:phage major capsid protein [Acinetobacter sp. HY1485]